MQLTFIVMKEGNAASIGLQANVKYIKKTSRGQHSTGDRFTITLTFLNYETT